MVRAVVFTETLGDVGMNPLRAYLLVLTLFGSQAAMANCGDRIFISGRPNKLENAVLKKIESSGYKIVNDVRDADYAVSVYRNNISTFEMTVGSPAAIISRPQRLGSGVQLVARHGSGFDKASLLTFSNQVEMFIRNDKYCE